jgi:transcriptional regulator with XRE-family HTH domain
MIVQDRQHIDQLENDSLTSPKAKGERLKRIRNLANLSREEFCVDTEFTLAALISWEMGRFNGLSAKGAARVIARVAKEGVFCTPEWLLYEVGAGPEVKADYKKLQPQPENVDSETAVIPEKTAIIEELILFRKLNKNAIDYVIEDDAMLPHYRAGDYVAGTKRFGEKIKSLISMDCIVQMNDGRIIMRNLQLGPRENSFNLISTNLHAKTKDAIIYDVNIVVAAPVLWHRRKDLID